MPSCVTMTRSSERGLSMTVARIMPKNTKLDNLTPEGLWVACRLQLKRTRNPACFRRNRYFVAWKAGSTPPYPVQTLHDTTFLLWAWEDSPPSTGVTWPKKLRETSGFAT